MADSYKRKESAGYNLAQSFADEKIGPCPFCNTENPGWLTREEWKVFGGSLCYFKCPVCESELMIPKDDVTGMSYSKATAGGKKKLKEGKIGNLPYVTVMKIGLTVKNHQNMLLQHEEMPLPKLKELCEAEARNKETK